MVPNILIAYYPARKKLSCCKTTDLCHHFSLFSESREGPNVRYVKRPVPLSDYLHLSFLFIVSSWNHDQVVVSRVLRLHHHPLFSGHDARLTVRRPLLGWRRVSILIRRNSKTVAHPHLLIGDGGHDLSLASPISFPGKQELVVVVFVFFDHEAFLSAGGHAVGRGGVNSTLSHCSGGHHRAAEVCVSRTEVIGAARGLALAEGRSAERLRSQRCISSVRWGDLVGAAALPCALLVSGSLSSTGTSPALFEKLSAFVHNVPHLKHTANGEVVNDVFAKHSQLAGVRATEDALKRQRVHGGRDGDRGHVLQQHLERRNKDWCG